MSRNGDLSRENEPGIPGYLILRIRYASSAAFSPLSIPTQATGTPFGIWTIESSASIPFSFPLTGTPITGLWVLDAITPGRAAESPAIAIKILQLLFFMYSSSISGSRWAEMTRESY